MTENIELDSPEVRHSAQALTETGSIVPEIDDRRLPAALDRSGRDAIYQNANFKSGFRT